MIDDLILIRIDSMFPNFEDLINEIKSKRKDLGWSQKKLANKAGVSQSLVAKLEQRNTVPNYKSVRKIFKTLERKTSQEETVEKFVNEDIVSIKPGDKSSAASEKMLENDFSQLPVESEEGFLGIVLSKDLGTVEDDTPIEEVMRRELPGIPSNSPKSAAAELLKKYSAVLVKEGDDVLGIITPADLL